MARHRLGFKHSAQEIKLEGTGTKLSEWQSGTDKSKIDADALERAVSEWFDSGDVSCDIGLGDSPTRTTLAEVPADWQALVPLSAYMEVGGTVASGETVSISIKAILDDGTEIEMATYSVTGGTGSSTVGADTIMANLMDNARSAGVSLDGKRITSVVADVKTSATSTSATAKARVQGVKT